ncbi:polymorphic toxin type 43 domain-containing protein, partial [Roseateles sp. YR242]|uniref:polymorphic toxin type 43 domain-containing protein n=1 Tax=Roseateles sp. YR242 TaxID=1855305 RepID=UPI00116052FE
VQSEALLLHAYILASLGPSGKMAGRVLQTFPSLGATSRTGPNNPWGGGAGPIPGTIGVAPSSESVAALRNYFPGKNVEYVFDPDSSTFLVGNGMKHSPLAEALGADTNRVVGGIFSRGANGEILSTEGSGHFWQNWTPEVRQQYVDFMNSKGFTVVHHEGH